MEYASKGRRRAHSSTYNTNGGYPSSAHGHRGTYHRRGEDSRGEPIRNHHANRVPDNEGHRTGHHRRQSHSQGPVDGNGYRIHVRKRSDKPAHHARESEPSVESVVHRLAEIRLSQEAQERHRDRPEKSYKSKKYYSDKRPDPYYDSWDDEPPVQKGPHPFRPRQSHRYRPEKAHKPPKYHSEKRPGGSAPDPYYDSWNDEPPVEKGRRSFEPRYSEEAHRQYREKHANSNGSSDYSRGYSDYSRGYSDYYTSYGTSDHYTDYGTGDYYTTHGSSDCSRGCASSDYYRCHATHKEMPSYRAFYNQCTDPGGKRREKARRQREQQARAQEEPFHGFVEGEVSDAEDYLKGGSGHTK